MLASGRSPFLTTSSVRPHSPFEACRTWIACLLRRADPCHGHTPQSTAGRTSSLPSRAWSFSSSERSTSSSFHRSPRMRSSRQRHPHSTLRVGAPPSLPCILSRDRTNRPSRSSTRPSLPVSLPAPGSALPSRRLTIAGWRTRNGSARGRAGRTTWVSGVRPALLPAEATILTEPRRRDPVCRLDAFPLLVPLRVLLRRQAAKPVQLPHVCRLLQ